MIRTFEISLNAAHPELPLAEAVAYSGSPSAAFIHGVPPAIGVWRITSVYVAVLYPDGTDTTVTAALAANGVYVATLPATATAGRSTNGLRFLADGINENGETVTGYVLGVADFVVVSLDISPAPSPGLTAYPMRFYVSVPDPAHIGDVAVVNNVLSYYDGAAWRSFNNTSKGDDTYIKSEIVDGTQHYKKLVIVNNERIGWAFDLQGDYVLVDGEFQEAE